MVESQLDGPRLQRYRMFATRDFEEGEVLAEVEGVLGREAENWADTYSVSMSATAFSIAGSGHQPR